MRKNLRINEINQLECAKNGIKSVFVCAHRFLLGRPRISRIGTNGEFALLFFRTRISRINTNRELALFFGNNIHIDSNECFTKNCKRYAKNLIPKIKYLIFRNFSDIIFGVSLEIFVLIHLHRRVESFRILVPKFSLCFFCVVKRKVLFLHRFLKGKVYISYS